MCLNRTNWPNHSACMHFPRRGISKHDFGFMTNVVFFFFFFRGSCFVSATFAPSAIAEKGLYFAENAVSAGLFMPLFLL